MSGAGRVVAFVIVTALVGMTLGGLFGWAAGTLAPDLFRRLMPFVDNGQPVGTAVVVGAFGGVMCGGVLGAFAVAIEALTRRRG